MEEANEIKEGMELTPEEKIEEIKEEEQKEEGVPTTELIQKISLQKLENSNLRNKLKEYEIQVSYFVQKNQENSLVIEESKKKEELNQKEISKLIEERDHFELEVVNLSKDNDELKELVQEKEEEILTLKKKNPGGSSFIKLTLPFVLIFSAAIGFAYYRKSKN